MRSRQARHLLRFLSLHRLLRMAKTAASPPVICTTLAMLLTHCGQLPFRASSIAWIRFSAGVAMWAPSVIVSKAVDRNGRTGATSPAPPLHASMLAGRES